MSDAKNSRAQARSGFGIWLDQHLYSFVSSLGRTVRRPWATLLTIGVMAVAFVLPLGLWLALQNIGHFAGDVQQSREIDLFLTPDTPVARAQALAESLRSRDDVARVELGARTIFNIVGPLSSPARVKKQLFGVYSPEWLIPGAEALRDLGLTSAWVVHGSGLDEITTTGPSQVAELKDGARQELAQIDAMGGAVAAIEYMKGRLVESNSDRLARIESKETTVVGVNRWTETEPSPLTAGEGAIMVVDPAVEAQPKKPHEREPVAYLVFDPVIRQVVQLLQHQHLEHQHHVDWLGPRVALALFLIDSVQVGAKGFPVNFGIQSNQRVAHLGQLVCPFGYVKKSWLLYFLHRSSPVHKLHLGITFHNISGLTYSANFKDNL